MSHDDVKVDLSDNLTSTTSTTNTSAIRSYHPPPKRHTSFEPINPFTEDTNPGTVSSTYGAWGNDV